MQTIAVIAAGAGVPELLAAAAFAAAVNGFIRGCMNKDRLDHACRKYSENVMVSWLQGVTFVTVSAALREASKERFSNVRNNLSPSAFANILIPLSRVETANRVPSLLKRIRGLA